MSDTALNDREHEYRNCRDVNWFAGLAMQAIIAKQPTVPDTESEREEIALWSYRMGQAMLASARRLGVSKE